jgi:hypothetical protein
LRYLRFSPDEYRLLAGLCLQLDLGGRPQAAFKGLLVEALSGLSPDLAGQIARLSEAEIGLLHDHFRPRTGSEDEHDLTPEELRVVLAACVSTPFPMRFVRHFKGLLVELLRVDWPELSRKVGRLSGHQFKRLYEQASRQDRERD